MKKTILMLALFLFTFNSYSQFGISLGYASSKAKISGSSLGGLSLSSENISSFSLGLLNNSSLSDATAIEYGIVVGFADGSNSLGIPLNLKYYTSGEQSGFHIIGGVGLGLALGDIDTETVKKTTFSGGLGLGFDLSSNISARVSYSTQLNNSSNIDGLTLKGSGIGLGIQYWFK